MLRIEAVVSDEWLQTISLAGELDAYTAPQLQEAVTGALSEGLIWLVVDLTQVDYIDSVGLGILIGGVKRAGERGGDLAVVSNRRNICKVFDVSGTAEMLNVVADVAAAVALLTQERAARADSAAEGGEDQ